MTPLAEVGQTLHITRVNLTPLFGTRVDATLVIDCLFAYALRIILHGVDRRTLNAGLNLIKFTKNNATGIGPKF